MGIRLTETYATVWDTKPGRGNYTEARISTSKKNKQTEMLETDYSGFVRLCGEAHKKAGSLKQKDRIKIISGELTNSYSKEKNTTYYNIAIYDYELAQGRGAAVVQPQDPEQNHDVDDPDFMPF